MFPHKGKMEQEWYHPGLSDSDVVFPLFINPSKGSLFLKALAAKKAGLISPPCPFRSYFFTQRERRREVSLFIQ